LATREVRAQDDKQPAEPMAAPSASAPIAPTKPLAGPPAIPASDLDTFLLRDSKGNLVPMIGLTFEDFEKLILLKKGMKPPQPPAFTIDSLTISGKAAGEVAELQAAVTIRVRQPGWVKVPLRLSPAALVEPASHEGPGEHILSAGTDADGYILWLNGESKSHQVQLK